MTNAGGVAAFLIKKNKLLKNISLFQKLNFVSWREQRPAGDGAAATNSMSRGRQ